jgi:opacity protein-like surface antigen
MVKFKNAIGKGGFMKKLAVLGVLLAVLSVSAFAAPAVKVSIGAGGFFQYYKTTYELYNIKINSLEEKYYVGGIYGLLDATFLEANVGLTYGPYKLAGYPATSLNYLNLALYAKYPLVMNDKLTIFPLAGFDYNILLSFRQGSTQFERSDLSSSIEDQWDAFLWSIGGGMDYHINPNLFIRGELRWGFKIKNDYERRIYSSYSLFSTGPKFNLGLGYTF